MGLDLSFEKEMPVEVGKHISVTHNLVPMAKKAGLYNVMWRSHESFQKAEQMIPALKQGIEYMENNEEELKGLNPKNGWGSYEALLTAARKALENAKHYPDATPNSDI